MEIQHNTLLTSQTENECKYNVRLNISLPYSISSPKFPTINLQISIPNKSMNEQNIKIESKLEEKIKDQHQNKVDSSNYEIQSFRGHRHMNHDISVKNQNKVKIQDTGVFDSQGRNLQRSRTRDGRINLNPQSSPKLQIQSIKRTIENLFYKIENNSRKQSFFPLHNLTAGRYKIIDKKYSLNSELGQFIVTNDRICPNHQRTYIKFSVQNNDCSVGITVFTKDLLKYTKIKNRYMTYSFKTNQMNVREAIYNSKKVEDPTLTVYICLVDLIRKRFMIMNQNQIIRTDIIPQQFVNEDIHFFIELKDKGKIKFL